MDTISIIVPVYNTEKFVIRALKSISNQTYKNIEIIVVNDGSTDNSLEIVEKYANDDTRIKVYSKKNGGLSSARNFGISKANGKYIMFIDSDDFIDSIMVESMSEGIKSENADLIVSGLYIDYENLNLETLSTKKVCSVAKKVITDKVEISHESMILKKGGVIDSCCNKLYKKEIIDRYNLFMPKGEMFEDTEFNFQYLNYVNKMVVLPECFYHYMQRNVNRITNTYNDKKLDFLFKRVSTMKNYIENNGDLKDMVYVAYWFSRYAYSTLMDVCKLKLDLDSIINAIFTSTQYQELKLIKFKYPNLFYKIYIESLLQKRTALIKLIVRISLYLKNKRNNKK